MGARDRDREGLERAQVHVLQADLELKRAIARGEVSASDEGVRRAQATMRQLSRHLAAKIAASDAPVARVLLFPPRPTGPAR